MLRGNETIWDARVALSPAYPLTLLRSGLASEAVAAARHALARHIRTKHGDGAKLALARGVLATALMASGHDRESLREFGIAVPALLDRARRSGFGLLDPVEDARADMVLEGYLRLLARVRGTALESEFGIDAVDQAFRVADTLRGRSVQRALNASAARAAAKNPELAALVRRMQDTVSRIRAGNAHYARLLSRPDGTSTAGAGTAFPGSIADLRAERDALRAAIDRRFPEYASLVSPRPPSIAEARATLRRGEALVAIHVGTEESYVWAVPKTEPGRFAVVPAGAAEIARLVRRIRQGVVPRAATLDGVPAFDVAAAHELYRLLLAPVGRALHGAGTLLVAAQGVLAQLPFSLLATEATPAQDGSGALFTGYRKVAWLARRHGVIALPAVSALTTLRKLPGAAGDRRSFAGFADPRFAALQPGASAGAGSGAGSGTGAPALVTRGLPLRFRAAPVPVRGDRATLASLPPLPDTAAEISSIAAVMKADAGRDLFVGVRANEDLVKRSALDRYRVLAFASHALQPGQLRGLTQPALALSAPEVAGVEGDGLLTAEEILGLRLNADWVVLSACNTAMGDGRGQEAVAGLGRAFLYAGARALLVSHWPVESASARQLVTDLFRRQAANSGISRSEALRQAMLALIDGPGFTAPNGDTLFSYAHPLFWAPFSIFGDGGAS